MEYPYIDEENGWFWFNEEFIVVNKPVEMKWGGSNKKHFKSLGYVCDNWHESFLVHVQELQRGSVKKVNAICPRCKKQRNVAFQGLMTVEHSKCQGCSQFIDRTGQNYGYCQVLEHDISSTSRRSIWKCLCRCGNVFTTLDFSLVNGDTKSCGCWKIESSKKRMLGENNPSYNLDLTDKEREIGRKYPEIRSWSKDIKIRDNFTCQCCGQVGGKLVSHHLNNYKDFPEQRCDLDNGITLCKTCHKEFHKRMGGNSVKCTHDGFTKFCEEFYQDALFLI